jgi:hypothetical protein
VHGGLDLATHLLQNPGDAVSFDAIAPHYRRLEYLLVGRKLDGARTALLREAGHCRNVLIAGEGDGRFLVACGAALPEARFTISSEWGLIHANCWIRKFTALRTGVSVLSCGGVRG